MRTTILVIWTNKGGEICVDSDESKRKLDKLAQRFFWMNKKLDRMKAVLNTKFAMPLLANRVHLELAHAYPLLADKVNDIEEMLTMILSI